MKKLKQFFSILIILVTITFFIWYCVKHFTEFKTLQLVSPLALFGLIVILLITYASTGVLNQVLLKPFNISLSFLESFGLSLATGFYNLITPFRGGMAFRALYLKNKHNFSFTNFIATLSGTYVITFCAASLLGIISFLALKLPFIHASGIIFLTFIAFFLGTSIILIASPKLPERKNQYLNKIIALINGWHTLKQNRKEVAILTAIMIFQLILSATATMLSYQVFGITLTLMQAAFLVAISTLGIVIQITPAGLGVNEAITVVSAYAIGITPIQSIPVALLGRITSFLVLTIGGGLASVLLLRKNVLKRNSE